MKKILVVNNDPDTIELLHDLLDRKGFETKVLINKDKVPDLIENFKPNLLLLDIN